MKRIILFISCTLLISACSTSGNQKSVNENTEQSISALKSSLEKLHMDLLQLDKKLNEKREFQETFYRTEDENIKDLLAIRTEQRFSDIREYISNIDEKINSLTATNKEQQQ